MWLLVRVHIHVHVYAYMWNVLGACHVITLTFSLLCRCDLACCLICSVIFSLPVSPPPPPPPLVPPLPTAAPSGPDVSFFLLATPPPPPPPPLAVFNLLADSAFLCALAARCASLKNKILITMC